MATIPGFTYLFKLNVPFQFLYIRRMFPPISFCFPVFHCASFTPLPFPYLFTVFFPFPHILIFFSFDTFNVFLFLYIPPIFTTTFFQSILLFPLFLHSVCFFYQYTSSSHSFFLSYFYPFNSLFLHPHIPFSFPFPLPFLLDP